MKNLERQEVIEFSFENKVGNTRDVHRLIQLGKCSSYSGLLGGKRRYTSCE